MKSLFYPIISLIGAVICCNTSLAQNSAKTQSSLIAQSRLLNEKYAGKTIAGLIKGTSNFKLNGLPNGYFFESGGVSYHLEVNMTEVKRLMKIIKGDIVIVEVGQITAYGDNPLPVLKPQNLWRDGEPFIQNGSVQI